MPNYCSIITYRTVLKWMTKTKTGTTPSPDANLATTVATTGTN
jgi:hypothetical protein